MAQPVEPTRLPDEATKLIREFAEWLGTTNTNNSREWDKKGDGIYLCIHSQCEEKIRTLKEKLNLPEDYKVLRIVGNKMRNIDWTNRPSRICPLRGLTQIIQEKLVVVGTVTTVRGEIWIEPDLDLLAY